MQSKKQKPHLISFEGIGAAGKSELARRLNKRFQDGGYHTLLYKPISRERLESALSPHEDAKEKEQLWVCLLPEVYPTVDALSFLSLLSFDSKEIIEPALAKNKVVIVDRYVDTVFVHVLARKKLKGLDFDEDKFIDWLLNTAAYSIKFPDITMVIDVPVDIASLRGTKREGRLYSEVDKKGFGYIREYYRKLADMDKTGRFEFIDGTRKIEKVEEEIYSKIKTRLREV